MMECLLLTDRFIETMLPVPDPCRFSSDFLCHFSRFCRYITGHLPRAHALASFVTANNSTHEKNSTDSLRMPERENVCVPWFSSRWR